MESVQSAVAQPFPDRRSDARSPYVAKLAAMEVGDRLKIPLRHRARVAALGTRWGKKWGKRFRTSTRGKTVALVGRVA